MATTKNKFTFKIILSYLVLGALSVLVGFFLFSEFEELSSQSGKGLGEKKIVETGTLINLVYEADGLSRYALLTESDSDFEKYIIKTDSLFLKIKEIQNLSTNDFQLKQLDSVKSLLIEKNQNIEQLRILGLTNKKDTSLDEILKEVQKLEASIGLISVESLIRNPSKLSRRERRVWQSYADYLNRNPARDTSRVRSKTVDSMLYASRYIVSEAKKTNSRIRESLRQKENELIRNDLKISERLRAIIASFDEEMAKRNDLAQEKEALSLERTARVLKFSGVVGGFVILIFSYFVLTDFFRAERYKKNLEESKNYAESLLKSREQLISTVSHDLKTPLNTISGYSELFENSLLSEKQKYYLSQITSSSKFISQLVDDLLDFSKLEAGKLPLERIPFSLENIIRESGNAVKQFHKEKPVDLNIWVSEEVQNKIFESDPLRIRQIINNLVGNAFKFTDSGSVQIIAKELETSNSFSTIQISVIDTGIGISEEKQNLIFNEFTQADTDIAHKFGGSGLGLSISKKLTELLGGSLTVKSVLGKGSTFILTLPLENSERKFAVHSINSATYFSGLKGIIIDDDKAMRALLKEIFLQLGVVTETFSGYKNFKDADINPHFDFILTDIQMPETDGFSILENLKNGKVDFYKGQPIIAMTGSREFSKEFHLAKGFSEMLPKPFSKEELVQALKRIFPKKDVHPAASDENTDFGKMPDPDSDAADSKFDLSLLKSFLSTPEALTEVLGIFEIQTGKDIEFIEAAITSNEIQHIKEIAHRMLTMFRQVRAFEVIPLLEKMEEYPDNPESTKYLRKDFELLRIKIQEFQEALKDRSF